jgi:hypothetical protein
VRPFTVRMQMLLVDMHDWWGVWQVGFEIVGHWNDGFSGRLREEKGLIRRGLAESEKNEFGHRQVRLTADGVKVARRLRQ